MFDFLLVALFQVAAGTPAPAPVAEPAPATEVDQQAEQPRRCRSRRVTGTRLSNLVTCRRGGNGQQSQDTREALHDLQRPAGTSG